MKGLAGKSILVTGASSGIGQAIAVRFAAEGAHVAVHYHGDEKGAKTTARQIAQAARKFGKDLPKSKKILDEPLLLQADAADEAALGQLFGCVLEAHGGLDILVNNAGMMLFDPKKPMNPVAQFDRMMAVNVRGYYVGSSLAIEHFLKTKKKGIIINVSSVHDSIPNVECIPYSMGKAAVTNLTKTLALKFAPKGIRVNGLSPGAIDTPINADWMKDPKKKKKVLETIPMGRIGDPAEMAAVAAFLASDEASYMTGHTIYADGGMMLYPDFGES